MNPGLSSPSARNAHIDMLRGLAVSGVLLLHFTLAYGLKNSPLGDALPTWLLRGLSLNGNFGVTMFFAVSGFLITTHALRRWGRLDRIDLRHFYLLRAARILPPLLLALAIIVALGLAGLPYFTNTDGGHSLPASHYWIAVGSVLTFWHNVLMQSAGYFNYCLNVYWSLSVEEVFYLALPLFCVVFRRTWLLVAACAVLIAVGPIYRHLHADNEIFFMYAYPACFDALAMGVLAALAASRRLPQPQSAPWLRGVCLLMLGVTWLRGIPSHEAAGFSLIALASAGYLYGSAQAGMGLLALRLSQPLRWMGRHSYEIYLFHIIVLGLMRNAISKAAVTHDLRLPLLAAFVAATLVVAAGVARWVSEPANAWLRRRYSKRPGALAA